MHVEPDDDEVLGMAQEQGVGKELDKDDDSCAGSSSFSLSAGLTMHVWCF